MALRQVPVSEVPRTVRYKGGDHLARYEQVMVLREAYPCMTLQAIGDQVGLTKERVRQLLKEEGLQTKAEHQARKNYNCLQCGKPFFVPDYLKRKGRNLKYCTPACQKAANLIPLICEGCGVLFYRPRHCVLTGAKRWQQHIFCGRTCYGRWVGTNRGFGAHPENIRKQ